MPSHWIVGLLLLLGSSVFAQNVTTTVQTDPPETECLNNLPDIDTVSLPQTEQLNYLEFDDTFKQVIIPQLKFTCSGIITSYSGLAVARSVPGLDFLRHQISFTVWRPRGEGLYDVVAHDLLQFTGSDLTRTNSTESLVYVQFTNKVPERGDTVLTPSGPISFQTGDILGWNSHQQTEGIIRSLNLVYTEAETQESFDALLVSSNTSQLAPCTVSECDDDSTSQLPSIIPYFSVQYVVVPAPNTSELTCESPESDPVIPCSESTTTAETVTTTTPTPCVGTLCSIDNSSIIFIAAAAVGIIIVFLILLVLITVIFLCCRARRRGRHFLVKLQGNQTYELEDNPTYNSADGVNEHHKSTDQLHFNAEDATALYAIPSKVYPNPEQTTTNLDELFDGECYASTYQTNGQCHIYQELPEAASTRTPTTMTATVGAASRMRSTSMVASREILNGSKPHLPLRITASSVSGSISKFPYTMPNTPCLSVFDLEAVPSFQCFPYTESKPSVTSEQRSSTVSYPYVGDGSSSVISSPYPEKPSISHLSTPNDTPPSSATIESISMQGHTVRKLFHAIDDEMLRVPNASERQELESLDNPDEIYSKLKHSYSKQIRDSGDSVLLSEQGQYWKPPSDPLELYDQLAKRKFREIQRKQIRVTDRIGGGNFGTVYKGLWQVPGGVMEVALKSLNPNSPDGNETKFLKEAAIMGQFLHTNVVKLLGVVTVGEPLMIVLELMPKGDLKQYLRSLDYASSMIKEDLPSLLISFCRQIGYGMNYLANKGFVHRDLAARNVLLAEDLTCKIGDFGMSRDLEEEAIYFSQGGKLPLRWTAPEALKYHHFSSASDVWSYGMLLFEIWSLGKRPFEGILTKRLMTLVYSGFCQAPPPGCPRALYKMMVECWHVEAEKRITFSQICTQLSSSSGESLLALSPDRTTSAASSRLGAPLREGKNLYLDLQYSYTNSSV